MSRIPPVSKLLFFVACMVVVTTSNAQPGPPAGDPDVPISGIEILIGIGSLFGAKKFYDFRKRTKHNP
jgi:hypothetical protein